MLLFGIFNVSVAAERIPDNFKYKDDIKTWWDDEDF